MQQQPVRRIPLGLAAGFTGLILAAGGATAWWTWNSATSEKPLATTTAPQPTPAPQPPAGVISPTVPPPTTVSPQPQQTQPALPTAQTAQIYWLKDAGNKIALVPSPVTLDSTDQPSEALTTAFNRLLSGPTNPADATTIPEGTKLKSVTVRGDGIHVDLSQAFTAGGGSASMQGRVAQVLYTATSLDPKSKVWISVEGEPLEDLGGEGLLLEQPITRQNFQQNFTL